MVENAVSYESLGIISLHIIFIVDELKVVKKKTGLTNPKLSVQSANPLQGI